MAAMLEGNQNSTPVPLAGDRYLDTTFGIERRMWSLVNRTASLLSNAAIATPLGPDVRSYLLATESQSILCQSQAIVGEAKSELERVQLGTKVRLEWVARTLVTCSHDTPTDDASHSVHSAPL